MTTRDLTAVTPVLLTFNEEPNLRRALESLSWARSIVIVDSGSTDATEAVARRFPQVRWIVRPFDTHGRQWHYGIHETGIDTPFVLALDADYSVPVAFVEELQEAITSETIAGGIAGFEYRIDGRPLWGSIYPAKLVLLRRDAVRITQPGHSQEFAVDGEVHRFRARLVHDDRKPFERFVASQVAYSRLEFARLRAHGPLRWQDRLRSTGLMPLVAGVAAYLRCGGPFRGRAALRYAYERMLFESLLAMRVIAEEPGLADAATDHVEADR